MSKFNEFLKAIRREDLAEIKKLFKKEFIKERDSGGLTALHVASMYNNEGDTAEYLIEEGCDLEAKNDSGRRSIHFAAAWGRVAVLRVLTECGCTLGALTSDGQSASGLALEYGKSECWEIIKRAAAERFNKFEEFLKAIKREDLANVKRLFKKEFIKERDSGGLTALHWASLHNKEGDTAEYLIEEGCDLEAKNDSGRRSIHFAAACGRVAVLRVLTERGCTLGALTKDGRSASDLALEYGKSECRRIIKRAETVAAERRTETNVEQAGASNILECSICKDNPVDCTLNCGHMFCMSCAERVIDCFKCRRRITDRIKVFM